MNKSQKNARRQERHELQKNRRLEKKKELLVAKESTPEEEVDLEAGDSIEEEAPETEIDQVDEVEEAEELEPVQKDMYGNSPMEMPAPMGPVSFDELDAAEAAQESASEIQEVSWNVQDLVRNILNHPMMDAAEKASAIQKVGEDFQGRVDDILSGAPDPMEMQKDMDLLELEALIASDNRSLSLKERMGDWITKAALSYKAKQNQPDSSYALVVTRGGKKIRKYLIHDKAHVRDALSRAAAQINSKGAGAADAKAALPKIHAAAKRMGIGSMKKETGAIVIQKDAAGDWRWVGWPSNNFIDLHSDIISKEAHQEYVDFLDKHPDMAPLFMTWHTPGTERKNPADYWAFENGFLIMSGKLEESEAASLLKAQTLTPLGMSIQGFGLRESDDPRVITKYRAFEVSDLPLENAANPFTDFSIISKEVDMDKNAYLAAILGSPEKAAEFLKKTELKQEALEKAGVTQKSTDPAPVVENKVEKVLATAQVAKPDDKKALFEEFLKELQIEDLNQFVMDAQEAMEKIPLLEGLVKEMQGNREEQLAEMITPVASRFAWAKDKRASVSDDTKIEKTDPLTTKVPGLSDGDWLNRATGTTPIAVEPIQQ